MSQTTSHLLGRNTALNFSGQVGVGIAALLAIPPTLRILGVDRYGLLSLALVGFGLFGFLDLGLGRATTKFFAEYLHSGEVHRLASVLWTSACLQALAGGLSGAVIAWNAEFLVSNTLKIEPALLPEAVRVLTILAAAMPFVLSSSAFRGALEGAQRFDLVNAVKVPLNVGTYLLPLAAAYRGVRISEIVLILAAARAIATATYAGLCWKAFPVLRSRFEISRSTAARVIRYAGWACISNVIAPVLVQIERVFVASLVAVGAVTFYSVPFELISGLFIIPASIAPTVFPEFSATRTRDSEPQFAALYARSIKYLLLLLGPVVLVVAVFSREILLWWQGPQVAEHSSLVLQILAAGMFVNSLSWIPVTFLMGVGRPDITAKIHLVQAPCYFIVSWWLVSRYGVVGAALGFAARVAFEAALLFGASLHLSPSSRRALLDRNSLTAFGVLICLAASLISLKCMPIAPLTQAGITASLLGCSLGVWWFCILDDLDKDFFRALLFIRK